MAADNVVVVDRKDPDVHRRRLRELSPSGFDYIVEATGSTILLEDALTFVRRRGTVLVYAVYPDDALARIKPADIMRREVTIKGSFFTTSGKVRLSLKIDRKRNP